MAQVDSIEIPVLRAEPFKARKILSKEDILEIMRSCDMHSSKRLAGVFDVNVMTINNIKREYLLVNNVLYRRV